ncbi:SWIM zinc finger family protein [Mariannaea sp. PMI_226]|nr:SWIM zinc finger family protein [Mariannaea sp. PMI_226]
MSSSPTSDIAKLSLETMPPTTIPPTQAESGADEEPRQSVEEDSSPGFDSDDSDLSDFEDDTSTIVQSPSKLTYQIDHLSDSTQKAIRDAFGEPPRIAIEKCRRIEDTYAFQMTELVTRSIRIRAPQDGTTQLTCSCGHQNEPCEHLLWLLDQVVKQTLYDQDSAKPLKMMGAGYPSEMGDPFQTIADHHLEVLADDIHCQVVTPDLEYDNELDPRRVEEARELLSSIYGVPVEEYRPDISVHPVGKDVFRHQDLDYTIFRMLLDNHHFFHYFLSLSRETNLLQDEFRKYSHRVDRILTILDANISSLVTSSPHTSRERPPDVAWASLHIIGTIDLIKNELYRRREPLQLAQAISAARSLVHILEAVVGRNRDVQIDSSRLERNIYLRLIGDRDQSFVIGVLELIPEAASQFLISLESILDQIKIHGAPATYVDKFHNLISRLRTSTIGGGVKRQGQTDEMDRKSKRMK